MHKIIVEEKELRGEPGYYIALEIDGEIKSAFACGKSSNVQADINNIKNALTMLPIYPEEDLTPEEFFSSVVLHERKKINAQNNL